MKIDSRLLRAAIAAILAFAVPCLSAAETERVTRGPESSSGNDASVEPVVSASGRYVAFHSLASNLISDDSNDSYDVFVLDRNTATIGSYPQFSY